MVLHGYERPNIGYAVGNCLCYGYKPVEVSPEGLEHVLSVINVRLENLKKSWKFDIEHPNATIKVNRGSRRFPKIVELTPKDGYVYAREREIERSQLKWQIKQVARDKRQLEKAIKEWKPRPLPGQKGE